MTARRGASSLAGALALVILALHAPTARALPTKIECAEAHQDAQRLRSSGDLRGARDKLLVCSRDPCPKVVLDECVPWLAEVEHAMPTVVAEVRTVDGRDVPDVRVLVDGRPTLNRLDGRPFNLNPGEHVLRFEPPRGAAIEQRVVIAEGEKDRVVRAVFDDAAAAPRPTPPNEAPHRTGPPPASIVLGGVGVVALGGFTILGLSGLSAEHDLRDCTPTCSSSRVSDVQRRYVAADVFLGVGIVALGIATYIWLTDR